MTLLGRAWNPRHAWPEVHRCIALCETTFFYKLASPTATSGGGPSGTYRCPTLFSCVSDSCSSASDSSETMSSVCLHKSSVVASRTVKALTGVIPVRYLPAAVRTFASGEPFAQLSGWCLAGAA